MTDLKERAIETVVKNQDELIQLVMSLIRHASTKGNELSAQSFFASKLRELGAEVDMFEPDIEKLRQHPGFVTDRTSFVGSPVIGSVLKGYGGGKSMILCGHMDVVDPGDGAWTNDPFSPSYADGKIYGRGACDMKGGIACNYMAVKSLQDAGIRLKGDVKILSTIDEEVGNCGILALMEKGYSADGALVTEPTDEALTVSSAGSVWFKLHIYGKAAHGGIAYNGVNAIYKALPFINRIRDWQEERRLRLFGKVQFYENLPVAFCTGVNMIHSGTMPAIVPAEAILDGRIGISPQETTEEVMKEFEGMIRGVAQADPWTIEYPPLVEYHPSRWVSRNLDPDFPLVQTVKANFHEVKGVYPVIDGMKACSDSGTLQRYGHTPAFEFGPGPGTTLHKTDEYVSAESLLNVTKVIATTLIDWCGVVE